MSPRVPSPGQAALCGSEGGPAGWGPCSSRAALGPAGVRLPKVCPRVPYCGRPPWGLRGRLCQNCPAPGCRQPTRELFRASLLDFTGNSEAARLRLSKSHKT